MKNNKNNQQKYRFFIQEKTYRGNLFPEWCVVYNNDLRCGIQIFQSGVTNPLSETTSNSFTLGQCGEEISFYPYDFDDYEQYFIKIKDKINFVNKIQFDYTRADGKTKNYIAIPIEDQGGDTFSAYVFKEGIRSFNYSKIKNLTEVAEVAEDVPF